MGSTAVMGEVTDDALDVVGPLVAGDGSALVSDGRLDLTALQGLADGLDRVSTADVRDARRDLVATVEQGARPAAIQEAAVTLLELSDRFVDAVEQARTGTELMAAMLGAEEPRRYLLAVQNPGELRGTGGLVGFLAVLEFDDGRVTLAEPRGVDPSSRIDGTVLVTTSRFSRNERFSLTGPDAYEARYGDLGGASFLPSTNLDPDLPTVAPLILEQYAMASGEDLDGLIAIDPLGLELIQAAIGPLEVPPTVADLSTQLPDPIPADQLAQLLLIDSYEALGGASPDRRLYQAEVARAALSGALAGGWSPIALGLGVGEAVSSRHLQLYSTRSDEQATIISLRAGGELAPMVDGDDLIAIVGSNIAGNKADVHVSHRVSHDIALVIDDRAHQPELLRRSTSRIAILNGVDPAGDRYITTSLLPRHVSEERVHDDRIGLVNTWITFWGPAGTSIRRAVDLDGDPAHLSSAELHDLRAIDHLLETPNGTTTGLELEVTAPTGIEMNGEEAVYGLTLWRQAKGIADHVEVVVTPPDGWWISDATLTGGGPDLGLGPEPFTTRLHLVDVDGSELHISGSMSADARLTLTLERL
jgi:hypothetical protein